MAGWAQDENGIAAVITGFMKDHFSRYNCWS